jgi:peptidoglycan/xylan/chitin deacetylase (PgdA/CDA1 family)
MTSYSQEYDHSFMHHDSQLYYVPDCTQRIIVSNYNSDAAEWMVPMTKLTASSIVEVPANWHLDDWPPMQPKMPTASGFVDTYVVERLWREQFDFLYREYDSFVFPISIHPQVSGKPQVILMHERLIEYINSHEGIEWCTFEKMVKLFKDGEFGGVTVEGGEDMSK